MLQLIPREQSRRLRSRSGRLLIGSASYCDCRLDTLPPLAAVVARYSNRWLLHSLKADVPISCNDAYVLSSRVVDGRELWTFGNEEFTTLVVGGDADAGDDDSAAMQPARLELLVTNGPAEQITLSDDTLIGAAAECDLNPDGANLLQARHCLVVGWNGDWYLHNLTDSEGQINGSPMDDGYCRLGSKDVVEIGPLRVQFDPPARPVSAGTTDQSIVNTNPQLSSITDDESEFAALAMRTCGELQAIHKTSYPKVSFPDGWIMRFKSMPLLNQAEKAFMSNRQYWAMQRLRELLRNDPWNRTLLLTFARMCDVEGLDEVCLRVLELLHKRNPRDSMVNRAIARVCTLLGAERPEFYSQAVEHWEFVQRTGPSDAATIQESIQKLQSRYS